MLKTAAIVRTILAATALASIYHGQASAQDQREEQLSPGVTAPATVSSWGLGLGVATERETYKGDGNKTQVIPLLMYDSEYVRVFGNMVDLKLPTALGIRFALRAK